MKHSQLNHYKTSTAEKEIIFFVVVFFLEKFARTEVFMLLFLTCPLCLYYGQT